MNEIKKYAHTDLTDYRSGLLVSYWKFQPIMNYKYLEDTSINPQLSQIQGGASMSNRLVYLNDITYPVKCKYEEMWDYTS
jgi:hypothetical protein